MYVLYYIYKPGSYHTDNLSYREERKQVDDVLSFFMNAELPDFKYQGSDKAQPPQPKPVDAIKVY